MSDTTEQTPEWAMQKAREVYAKAGGGKLFKEEADVLIEAIARAIMAAYREATERERERCLKIAGEDRRSDLAKQFNHKPLAHRYAMAIAAAIRKGEK